MLFELNSHDYTKYIIPGTYKVNSEEVFETYEDARGINHYIKIRDRVSGTFNMEIHNYKEYCKFVEDLRLAQSKLNNTHNVYLMVNNLAKGDNYHCIIKVPAIRNTSGKFEDYIEQFTVSVEER